MLEVIAKATESTGFPMVFLQKYPLS